MRIERDTSAAGVCASKSSRARATIASGCGEVTFNNRTCRSMLAGRSSTVTISRMPVISVLSADTRIVRPSGPPTTVTSVCCREVSSDFNACNTVSDVAFVSGIAAIARSPRNRSPRTIPGFSVKPSISATKRSASSMESSEPTSVTRRASGSATTVGRFSGG